MNPYNAKFVIYLLINKINGKKYIGQTIQSLRKRMKAHFNYKFANSLIDREIARYGKANFKIYIVKRCTSVEELNTLECFYIKKFNTLIPNGYNVELGGNNKGQTEYEKEKQRKRFKDPIYKSKFIDKMNSDNVISKIAIGTVEGIYSTPGEIDRRKKLMNDRLKDPYQRYQLSGKRLIEVGCFGKHPYIDWQFVDMIYELKNMEFTASEIADAVNELPWIKRKVNKIYIYSLIYKYQNHDGTESYK